jgi:Lysozyme inhibitor LprI
MTWGPSTLLWLLRRLGLLCAAAAYAAAQPPTLHILWKTISPDGRYAMAWATTASEDDLPAPADHDQNPVSNYVVETASGNVIMQIPDGHYWETDHQPNHYDFEPAWSPDYTHLIAVYNGRWSFDLVVIADLKQGRVWNVGDKLAADFRRHLRATAGPAYLRTQDKLAISFSSPWFLAPGRFCVRADAEVPKSAEDREFQNLLYFGLRNPGDSLVFEKAEKVPGDQDFAGSFLLADRELNRTYQTLRALLPAEERQKLVAQQRAWLRQRDAITDARRRVTFVSDRRQELEALLEKVIAEKKR